eukprot:TRINITY_DN8667_c0_g1_i1.p1 TRINITY_DN8667_c0_g1~~TRINITY_DN8667_c0_g1_i1.p1  ORF type:complete len:611 (-),score=127.68 TRINITY_DN8667_c0_g1_i1:821-2653(-)
MDMVLEQVIDKKEEIQTLVQQGQTVSNSLVTLAWTLLKADVVLVNVEKIRSEIAVVVQNIQKASIFSLTGQLNAQVSYAELKGNILHHQNTLQKNIEDFIKALDDFLIEGQKDEIFVQHLEKIVEVTKRTFPCFTKVASVLPDIPGQQSILTASQTVAKSIERLISTAVNDLHNTGDMTCQALFVNAKNTAKKQFESAWEIVKLTCLKEIELEEVLGEAVKTMNLLATQLYEERTLSDETSTPLEVVTQARVVHKLAYDLVFSTSTSNSLPVTKELCSSIEILLKKTFGTALSLSDNNKIKEGILLSAKIAQEMSKLLSSKLNRMDTNSNEIIHTNLMQVVKSLNWLIQYLNKIPGYDNLSLDLEGNLKMVVSYELQNCLDFLEQVTEHISLEHELSSEKEDNHLTQNQKETNLGLFKASTDIVSSTHRLVSLIYEGERERDFSLRNTTTAYDNKLGERICNDLKKLKTIIGSLETAILNAFKGLLQRNELVNVANSVACATEKLVSIKAVNDVVSARNMSTAARTVALAVSHLIEIVKKAFVTLLEEDPLQSSSIKDLSEKKEVEQQIKIAKKQWYQRRVRGGRMDPLRSESCCSSNCQTNGYGTRASD